MLKRKCKYCKKMFVKDPKHQKVCIKCANQNRTNNRGIGFCGGVDHHWVKNGKIDWKKVEEARELHNSV